MKSLFFISQYSALHIAAGSQKASCVHVLLQHNAKMISDLSGKLPKELARHEDVILLFDGT